MTISILILSEALWRLIFSLRQSRRHPVSAASSSSHSWLSLEELVNLVWVYIATTLPTLLPGWTTPGPADMREMWLDNVLPMLAAVKCFTDWETGLMTSVVKDAEVQFKFTSLPYSYTAFFLCFFFQFVNTGFEFLWEQRKYNWNRNNLSSNRRKLNLIWLH